MTETANEPNEMCRNCGARRLGGWCQTCGQKHDSHQTLGAVFGHVLEGITHADSRVWRSLGLLVVRPGRLTRDWIEGRQARHVGPSHLFLFMVFLLFLSMGLSHAHLTPLVTDSAGMGSEWTWVREKWAANPELSRYKVDAWAYKLAFLMVPTLMLGVALATLGRRGYDLYDHGIFALHELAFLGLFSLVMVFLPGLNADQGLQIILIALFVHGTMHLHSAYRLGWAGAVVRGLALTAFGMGMSLAAVYVAGYAAMML